MFAIGERLILIKMMRFGKLFKIKSLFRYGDIRGWESNPLNDLLLFFVPHVVLLQSQLKCDCTMTAVTYCEVGWHRIAGYCDHSKPKRLSMQAMGVEPNELLVVPARVDATLTVCTWAMLDAGP